VSRYAFTAGDSRREVERRGADLFLRGAGVSIGPLSGPAALLADELLSLAETWQAAEQRAAWRAGDDLPAHEEDVLLLHQGAPWSDDTPGPIWYSVDAYDRERGRWGAEFPVKAWRELPPGPA
jgi:hypothetical protein